ncbi:MAG: metallophosphoesterase [Hydrogenothermaceae bacterium]|nr:metallophosphoesterase [Hydrogenothermaceae bacterium]
MERFLEVQIKERYFVVGDIHGCLEDFRELLRLIEEKYGKDYLVISVGDTIDRRAYNIQTLLFTLQMYKKDRFFRG